MITYTHPADRIIDGLGGWNPESGKTGLNNHKVGNNLWLSCVPEGHLVQVRLHETVIVEYKLDSNHWVMILDTGGFKTRTTLNRMNAYLPSGYQVTGSWLDTTKVWYLTRDKHIVGEFILGMVAFQLPFKDWPTFAFDRSSKVGPTL